VKRISWTIAAALVVGLFLPVNAAQADPSTTYGYVGSGPRFMVFDQEGNMYVANYGANFVSKIYPTGDSESLASTGANPRGIAIDSAGNIYTANFGSNTVSKITPAGVSTIFATVGTNPSDLIFDQAGNLYTANYGSNNVSKITPGGVSTIFGTTGSFPLGIAIDSSGNIYTSNSGSNNVSKITPAGASTIFATLPTGSSPSVMVFDSSGNLYTGNGNATVSKITPAGVPTIFGTPNQGAGLYGITIDPAGNIYTSNTVNNNVSKITPAGVTSILGTTGQGPRAVIYNSGSIYTTNNDTTVTKITLTNSQATIQDGTYSCASGVRSSAAPTYTITNGVVSEGGSCSGSVVIPTGATAIGDSAFSDTSDLTSVTIPSSVAYIGSRAFSDSGLTSISIPSSVTYIGTGAFQSNRSLTSAVIPNGIKAIPGSLFRNCNNLSSFTIPNTVTAIGGYAFAETAINSITIPGSVKVIYESFREMPELTSISIPSSVTAIFPTSFYNNPKMSSINVDSNSASFKSVNGVLFSKDGSKILQYPIAKVGTSYVIPNGVSYIEAYSFFGAPLTSVTIPNGVTYISGDAFLNLQITSITIPNSVRTIWYDAFNGTALTSLTIPNSVTDIRGNSFANIGSLTSYEYCEVALDPAVLSAAGLGSKTKTCTSAARVSAGTTPNSKVAAIPLGVTTATMAATDVLPSTTLNFGGTVPTAVTVVPVASNPAAPASTPFKISGSTKIVDIQITGTFNGSATVCLDGAPTDSIFHFVGGKWEVLPSRSYANGQVCGVTTSFSPFAAAEPVAAITVGSVPNSQVATFSSSIKAAVIPATAALPAITLNFGGTVPTSVTVVPVASNPAAPASTPFKILGSTKIVDITPTGTFTGSATVCLDGGPTDSIFHFVGGKWEELPSRSYADGQVCGVTTSFSPFAAAEALAIVAPVNSAPDAPASVVATATGKRTATVSFAAPASNGGAVITSYTATSTPGSITKTLTQAGSGSFNIDGLQPGTSYTFAVTAKNANGTSTAGTSNSIKTSAADVASLTSITFTDDGSGTAGKLTWVGSKIDSVLYTGPAGSYPGPFTFGAFSSSWNGSIRNLTPETSYTISIYAVSVDGIGESKSLTFKTGVKTDLVKNLAYWNTWLTANTYTNGEAARLFGLLTKFNSLETSPIRSFIKVPISLASTVSATSLTPKSCSVVSTTAKVDAGMVKALTKDTCTISYTVSGPSKAPATLVKDFVFKKVG